LSINLSLSFSLSLSLSKREREREKETKGFIDNQKVTEAVLKWEREREEKRGREKFY
jgi:hypothetical protein